jgi:phage terminase Nu1 subunit (DNA packaging protein)
MRYVREDLAAVTWRGQPRPSEAPSGPDTAANIERVTARDGAARLVDDRQTERIDLEEATVTPDEVKCATVTVEQLARLLDVTPRRVQQLVAEGRLRKVAHGHYPLLPAIRAYIRHLKQEIPLDSGATLTAERARLAKEQADRLAMQNATARRELAPLSLIEETIAKSAAQTSKKLEGIVPQIKRRVPEMSAVALQIIEEEIDAACSLAANIRLRDLDEPADDDDRLEDSADIVDPPVPLE